MHTRRPASSIRRLGLRLAAKSLALFTVSALVALSVPRDVLAQFQTVYNFTAPDGGSVSSPLAVRADGKLFGAGTSNGALGYGTVFSINPDGTGLAVLKNLDSVTSGDSPYGGVIVGVDGRIYGATFSGGSTSRGTIFRLEADGTNFTVLHSLAFPGTEGASIWSGVSQASDGLLYGSTITSGAAGWGTVFRLNTDGSGFTVLRHFANDANGGQPYGRPAHGSDGWIYGTTYRGGAFGNGVIYRMERDGTGYTVLHSFAGVDPAGGANPFAGVLVTPDGKLYGSTTFGGLYDGGVIYRLNTDGTGYTVLRHMRSSNPEGNNSFNAVPILSGGRLYVSAGFNGTAGGGSVFSMNPDGSSFAVEVGFDGSNGRNPNAGVVQGADGRLYGTTRNAGTGAYGTLFRLGSAIVPPVTTATLYAIGDLAGGLNSSQVRDATKVNGTLIAVGSGTQRTAGLDTAIRWTSTGGLAALPDIVTNTTGTSALIASAISRDGAVIASRARKAATGNTRVAVLVSNQGTVNTQLGYLSGNATYSAANTISDDGTVAYGFSRTVDATGAHQAFRWTSATGPVAIPYLRPGDLTNFPAGRGASSNGAIMVGTASGASLPDRAYRYIHGTGVDALPLLAGGTRTSALAITPDGGTILGTADSPTAPNGEIVRWNGPLATVTALGTPNAAWTPSNFGGVTADGAVAVVSFTMSSGVDDGFVRNAHGWFSLTSALTAGGANLSGWSTLAAIGITPDGTLVFGSGNHNGSDEGWVAELPVNFLRDFNPPDTTAPVLTLPSDIVAEATGPGGAHVSFSASALDDRDGAVPVAYSPAPGSLFAITRTIVGVASSDAAGNQATGSFAVTVRDTTAPTILAPSNLTLEATGASGATATFSASASDTVDGTVPVTASPASGSTFALGTTAVALTATDAHGNTANTSFNITVRDTTAPTLVLPANITTEATSASGATVTFAVSANDAVGVASLTTSAASGSVFTLGTTTVVATATDQAGNSRSGSFTVTVQDTVAPTITSLTASATSLWPANHKLVAITLNAAATDAVAVTSLKIVNVTSSEPDNGLGDGDTAGDIEITGALTLNLRAERSGQDDGRTYTVTVEARDQAGHTTTRAIAIVVPKNQGGR